MFFIKRGEFNVIMLKLFISQPMRDRPEEEILDEREYAIKRVKCVVGEVEVIDSYLKNIPENATPLWCLGKSIELLSTADIVYFCDGWDKARGCRIEQACAVAYGIDTMYD